MVLVSTIPQRFNFLSKKVQKIQFFIIDKLWRITRIIAAGTNHYIIRDSTVIVREKCCVFYHIGCGNNFSNPSVPLVHRVLVYECIDSLGRWGGMMLPRSDLSDEFRIRPSFSDLKLLHMFLDHKACKVVGKFVHSGYEWTHEFFNSIIFLFYLLIHFMGKI